MRASGDLCRQVPADAATSQLGEASASMLPLFPGDGAQPPPKPLVKPAQHRRGLAEAEVAAPPDQVDGQLLDDLREAAAAHAPRQFPNSCLEAGDRLRRYAPSRFASAGEAEAQELADARLGDRALGLVDLQPEALFEEPFDAGHHPFARTLTAHIDVAVVGVAYEAVTALLQFLVQHIQHQVRQQRRERSTLRRAFLRRADQSSLHRTRGQKAADEFRDALVSNPLGNEPHQDVMVDPVEELFQVDIHDDGVSGRNIRLRPLHRLMRRALRPEAEARLRERRVPAGLQHLHYRLLDQAVEHRRNAEQPHAARRLRYLYAPHRLRLVGAVKQLRPDRRPVLFQVVRQVIDTHAVDARRTFVAPYLRQRLLQVLTLENCFHRRPCDRRAFETGFRRARFGLSGGGASGFTLRPGAQVQFDLILLPHGSHEIAALIASSTVRAFGGALPPTTPSADFCAAVRSPYDGLSPQTGTQRRPPEVRPTAFAAPPPDLPPRPLMTVDFAISCSLVRPGRPRYPVFLHRAAALLHAFFRPHLAVSPLRFANPSPPSGWIEDSHLQAVVHTRHTTQKPPRFPLTACVV